MVFYEYRGTIRKTFVLRIVETTKKRHFRLKWYIKLTRIYLPYDFMYKIRYKPGKKCVIIHSKNSKAAVLANRRPFLFLRFNHQIQRQKY